MLIPRAHLDGIVAGDIRLAFRRWRRPTVKAGGTLTTAVGVLAIDAVDCVTSSSISDDDARQAGYPDRDSLLAELNRRSGGDVYRISLRYAGPDPRVALRRSAPDAADTEALRSRLERLDRASPTGPWTRGVMETIRDNEGRRAADLAAGLDMERDVFKRNVRKLKSLGLTESLEVGYRLSPRGRAVLMWERPPGRDV